MSAVSWASLETRDPWCKVVLSSVSVCVSSPTKIKHACVDHLLNCGYRTALLFILFLLLHTDKAVHDTGAYCLYCTAGNWASAQVPSSILKFAIAFLLHGPPPWPRQPRSPPVPHTAPHPYSLEVDACVSFLPIFLSFLFFLSFPTTSSSFFYTLHSLVTCFTIS